MLRMSTTFGRPLQRMQRIAPVFGQSSAARQQPLVLVDVERREAGRAGDRMRRIGVAVEQLDRALRAGHQRVVDLAAGEHRAAGNGAVGDALGGRHQVGRDAEIIGRERRAEAAEAGDDLVEDQQDAVLVAEFAQALQIALRRRQHARSNPAPARR